MKKAFLYILLMFLIGCRWADPILKTLKVCQKPTAINAAVSANSARKYTFLLAGVTADITFPITWKQGSTILGTSSTGAFEYTFGADGSYVITAEVLNVCGDKMSFTTTVSIKTCVVPTEIIIDSKNEQTVTYSLKPNTLPSIKLVIWRVVSAGNTIFQEQRLGESSFSYTFTASGNYTIVAEVETLCNEKATVSTNTLIELQVSSKIWDKTLGSSSRDEPYAGIVLTNDGGYLIGGFSDGGFSGDKTNQGSGGDDFWLVKINADGVKQWDKTYGGSNSDIMTNIIVTPDGGFLLGGYSDSKASNEKSENGFGKFDYWVLKIDANGTKQWDKTFGGADDDILTSVVSTSDGGFILGGTSSSASSGTKTENKRGITDYWIVKISGNGAKQWDRTFGGANTQSMTALISTSDGGALLGGWSTSDASGDKSENCLGGWDFWVVKIGANGQKQWDKTLGGGADDVLETLLFMPDRGFLLGGSSRSGSSGDKQEQNRGETDFWLVKITESGQKQWDKTYGGNGFDGMTNVIFMPNNSILLVGSSTSNISNDKSENSRGNRDFWIVNINESGQKQWDKTYGGNGDDNAGKALQTSDGRVVLVGYSDSNISGEKSENSRGGRDFWVVKIR
ncbi:MAG TPA: hypothetical protein DCM71_05300 [Runella sp.]|nr:hypothetical protein [Runella sp.]